MIMTNDTNDLPRSSKLLMDTPPLVIQKELAVALGSLDKALIMQQLHYWLKNNAEKRSQQHYKRGRWWSYNSYQEWKDGNFPFWSTTKIGRIFRELETDGLVSSERFNSHKHDQRKWYTINYRALEKKTECCTMERAKMPSSSASECNEPSLQNDTMKTETTTETTTEKEPAPDFLSDVVEFTKKKEQESWKEELPKGWHIDEITEKEWRTCMRVAILWTDGKLAHFANDIERSLSGANYLLDLHNDDLRATMFTIDSHHAETEEEGLTIAGPYSLRNVIPAFMAKNGIGANGKTAMKVGK